MATDTQLPGTLESWVTQAVAAFMEELFDPSKLQRLQGVIANGVATGKTVADGAGVQAVLSLASESTEFVESTLRFIEALVAPLMAKFAGHLLGVDVSSDDIRRAVRREGGSPIANAVIATVMSGLQPPPGELQPSGDSADRFIGMLGSLTFQSWFEGVLLEHVITMIPGQEAIESTSKLATALIGNLGLSRLARVALRPLVSTVVATPLEWKTNKAYRPQLLGPGEVSRQVARGRMTKEAALEELARQGWSDTRIEALLNSAAKFHSVSDVYLLVKAKQWSREQGIQHLRDQGYDPDVADLELTIEQLRAIATFERSMATTAVDAYADGRIGAGALDTFTHGVTLDNQEGAQLRELAEAKRALRVRPLTSPEARACVLRGILAVVDYREALRREGRDENAVLALELLLRADLDAATEIAEHRTAALAERAAEKAAAAAAVAARKAEIDQQRALTRRGPISRLERAVVRGLIPFSRLEEVLTAEYDPDTVAILVADVEQQRQDYQTQQANAENAKRRAGDQRIGIGDLEQAVLEHVLTLDEYRAGLMQRGLSPGDIEILAATLAARLADAAAAAATRAQAGAVAKARSIDLPRFERLVRRGVRTMAQYDQLLDSLGFDDAAKADLRDLLTLQIADDDEARRLRAEIEAQTPARALTLDQARRGVVLGVLTFDAFEAFLMQQGYATDAQRVLLAELRDDVADAEAARQRRAATGAAGVDARALPTATLRKAARLSLVTPDVYVDRLRADGFDEDAIAIELQLLLLEIADVQAARTATAAAPAPTDSGLTLGQVASAVKRGLKQLGDYQARAVQLGFSADDVATLVRVLADDLDGTALAKARRDAVEQDLSAAAVPLAALEQAVRDGQLTLAAFVATLQAKGLAAEDAALLAGLLADELNAE